MLNKLTLFSVNLQQYMCLYNPQISSTQSDFSARDSALRTLSVIPKHGFWPFEKK